MWDYIPAYFPAWMYYLPPPTSHFLVPTTPAKRMKTTNNSSPPPTLTIPGESISFRPHETHNTSSSSQVVVTIDEPIFSMNHLSRGLKRQHNGNILSDSMENLPSLNKKPNKKTEKIFKKDENQCEESILDFCLNQTTIYDILPECLTLIFEYLDLQSKGRAAQVCRSWRDACYMRSVWRNVEAKLVLDHGFGGSYRSLHLYPSLVRRGIRKVHVLNANRFLGTMLSKVDYLESVNFTGCHQLTNKTIEKAFGGTTLNDIEKVNLSLCKEISDSSILEITEACPNLRELDLSGCIGITNLSLSYIAYLCPKLEKLNLRSCSNITDDGFHSLFGDLSEMNNLRELGLQDCQRISDESLVAIEKYCNRNNNNGKTHCKLSEINLSFCVGVTDTGIKSLSRISSLEKLNLRSCENLSDLGVSYLSEGHCRKNILSLDTSFCSNVTDMGLKHVAGGMENLRQLSMTNCWSITNQGIIRLAKNVKSLESLKIGQCKLISDESILVVAKELIQLTTIDLYGCPKVSQISRKALSNMPKIKELNLQLHMK